MFLNPLVRTPVLRTMLTVFALAAVLVGCQSGPLAPAQSPSTLAKGTSVPLVLLRELESGVSDEKAEFPLMVREDVRDGSGRVLIPKGSPATGVVTWSRRAEMLSAMANRPARLSIRLLSVVTADGQTATLCTDREKVEEPFDLTRDNTGTSTATETVTELIRDEKNGEVIEAVRAAFDGKDLEALTTQEGRERLAKIGEDLGLPGLASIRQEGDASKVKGLLDRMRTGSRITDVAHLAAAGTPAVEAFLALSGISRQVGSRLQGISHGRNIRAYVGTPIDAFVAADVTVK